MVEPVHDTLISYSKEFDLALKKLTAKVEKPGRKVFAAVLAGSLSNRPPRLNQYEPSVLASDADIFFFVDKHIPDPNAPKQNPAVYNGECVFDQYNNLHPFSEHIPNADVWIFSVENAVTALTDFAQRCNESEPGEVKLRFGSVDITRTILLQAVLEGTVINGKIPDEVIAAAETAAKALHGRKIMPEDWWVGLKK